MTIEYIAPVESMRGNLSGKQSLEYPLSNGSAWDTPDNGISYARNYAPRYVGAKRVASGRNYFAVKRKSGVNLTLAQRKMMAALGVAKIYADAVLANVTAIATINKIWRDHAAAGIKYTTLSGFVTAMLRAGIIEGKRVISIGEEGVSEYAYSVTNVFNIKDTATGNLTPVVDRKVIAKFFAYIGVTDGDIVNFFYINSRNTPVVFVNNEDWGEIIESGESPLKTWQATFNAPVNLDSTTIAVGQADYMTANNLFIMKGSTYQRANMTPVANTIYQTTSTNPES